jgi:aspartyl aminopeptidase
LKEIENWTLAAGKKYYFTRNFTTIIAFSVGETFNPTNTGFKIIGTHTDSPCLKINPVSKAQNKGIDQCYVSTYGGGLWHTWFDRDLLLAGRVVYEEEGKYTSKLWKSPRPLLKIPNLAIHLSSDREKFEPNKETHLRPVLDSKVVKDLLDNHLKN